MCERSGRDPDRFWRLTPRLYLLEVLAHHRAAQSELKGTTYQTWLADVLRRKPEVTKLASLPGFERTDDRPRDGMTAWQVITTLRARLGKTGSDG